MEEVDDRRRWKIIIQSYRKNDTITTKQNCERFCLVKLVESYPANFSIDVIEKWEKDKM